MESSLASPVSDEPSAVSEVAQDFVWTIKEQQARR